MRRALGLFFACSSAGVLAAGPTKELEVIAAEVPRRESGGESEHATGDWGGHRARLVDRGIHFQAGYAGEMMANVAGGLRRGAIFAGLLELGLELRPDRMQLWENGWFRVTSLYPHGASVSRKYAGDILTASNIDAHDSFRLYELWYEHRFLADKFSLRLGQLTADDEFAFTEAGGTFLNSGFGWPAFISGNVVNTGPAFFVAAPGLRLRYEPNEQFFIQGGIYDGDSFDSPAGDARVNASGTRLHVSGEQGLFGMGEAGFGWHRGEEPKGLPGQFKVGAWLHTADFESHLGDGAPGRNFGFYATAEQMVWREADGQGLWAFARAGVAPRDRSFFEFTADFGIAGTGLLPGRDEDVAGVGFVHARISRDLRASERLDAEINGARYDAFSDYESVLEAFYSIQIRPWWTIQPDVQWIFHPGGSGAVADAVVLGVRTSIVF
jgi:porin